MRRASFVASLLPILSTLWLAVHREVTGTTQPAVRPAVIQPATDTAPSVRWTVLSAKLATQALATAKRAASHGDSTKLRAIGRAVGVYARAGPLLNAAMYLAADSARADATALSQRAAVASAAATVLVRFLPDFSVAIAREADRDMATERRAAVSKARIDAAVGLGRSVAQRTLEWAKGDGTDAGRWTGTIPTGPGIWWSARGVEPGLVERLKYRLWVLRSADQFRPKPPPAHGSPEFAAALDEVRRVARERTSEQTRIAQRWGLEGAVNAWTRIASEALIADGVTDPTAARVLALANAVSVDAGVACTDAKYHYWLLRPTQADSTITLADSLTVPNFPAYPSGHACISAAMAEVIAHFLPDRRSELTRLAEEAAMSRLYAGVHYRFDNDVGLELGRQVARFAIAEDSAGRLIPRWR